MPGAVLFVPSLWCCPGWLGDSGSVGGGCVCAHIGPALPTWLLPVGAVADSKSCSD